MSESKAASRRQFLGYTGAVGFSTLMAQAIGVDLALVSVAGAQTGKRVVQPFTFAIISDSHLYSMPDHKFDRALEDAVAQVNALSPLPDFVVYGGDIAQNGTEDQLVKGSKILAKLKMPMKVIPGEHDWYLDMGTAWRGLFGKETWSMDHKGVHLIGLNSILVKDFWTGAGMSPKERMGVMEMLESPIAGPWGIQSQQLEWLKKDVSGLGSETPVVVFTHSPLWDYYPRWNFQTSDAPEIRRTLSKFNHVMAFHGHVHQTVYNKIGNLSSIGSLSTSWPWPYPAVALPYPQTQMNRSDPSNETDGMGTQAIAIDTGFVGTVKHQAFADSLTPFMKNGYKV